MITKLSEVSFTLLWAALIYKAGAKDSSLSLTASDNNTTVEYNATSSYSYTISPVNTVGSDGTSTNFSKFDLTLNTGFRMYTSLDATIEPGQNPNATTDFWINRPSADITQDNCEKGVTYGVCATFIIIHNAIQLAQGQSGDDGSCSPVLSNDCIKAFETQYRGSGGKSISSSDEHACGSTQGFLPKECALTDHMGVQATVSHEIINTNIIEDNCSEFQQFGRISLSHSASSDHPINGLNTSVDAINTDPRKFYDLSVDTITVVLLKTWQQDITNNRSKFSSSLSQTNMFCTRPKDIVSGSYVPPSFKDTFLNETTNNTEEGSDKPGSATKLMGAGSTGWEFMLGVMGLSLFFNCL